MEEGKRGEGKDGRRKSREGKVHGEGLCSSKNFFKSSWSWTRSNFGTDRHLWLSPCLFSLICHYLIAHAPTLYYVRVTRIQWNLQM